MIQPEEIRVWRFTCKRCDETHDNEEQPDDLPRLWEELGPGRLICSSCSQQFAEWWNSVREERHR